MTGAPTCSFNHADDCCVHFAAKRCFAARNLGTSAWPRTIGRAVRSYPVRPGPRTAQGCAFGSRSRSRLSVPGQAPAVPACPVPHVDLQQQRRFTWPVWSGRRESNPHIQLGKLSFYHYARISYCACRRGLDFWDYCRASGNVPESCEGCLISAKYRCSGSKPANATTRAFSAVRGADKYIVNTCSPTSLVTIRSALDPYPPIAWCTFVSSRPNRTASARAAATSGSSRPSRSLLGTLSLR